MVCISYNVKNNGTDDVKAVADIITTDSNDEDGLAKTHKEIINNVN